MTNTTTTKATVRFEYSEGWGTVYKTFAFTSNKAMMDFTENYVKENDGKQFGGTLFLPRTIWSAKMTYTSGKSFTKRFH